ncbi:hypothetical protein [Streptomyces capitiformicae]|uniref:hypothetical protein n=1 Tax=Streptomyces capitiformicae TaxID=2014920 RepID=UPI00167B2542|nr:hypothetical protein [Streptomyces capitiformicae]
MAHTFDDLVEMQKAADKAHDQVRELQDAFGRPTATPWSPEQTDTYDKAWKNWRALADTIQAAVTEHAKDGGKLRFDVEAAVRTKARHPEPKPELAAA